MHLLKYLHRWLANAHLILSQLIASFFYPFRLHLVILETKLVAQKFPCHPPIQNARRFWKNSHRLHDRQILLLKNSCHFSKNNTLCCITIMVILAKILLRNPYTSASFTGFNQNFATKSPCSTWI